MEILLTSERDSAGCIEGVDEWDNAIAVFSRRVERSVAVVRDLDLKIIDRAVVRDLVVCSGNNLFHSVVVRSGLTVILGFLARRSRLVEVVLSRSEGEAAVLGVLHSLEQRCSGLPAVFVAGDSVELEAEDMLVIKLVADEGLQAGDRDLALGLVGVSHCAGVDRVVLGDCAGAGIDAH